MDTLNIAEPAVRSTNYGQIENEKLLFEKMWQQSISSDEFVKRAHEHLKNLYTARNKQNGSEVF